MKPTKLEWYYAVLLFVVLVAGPFIVGDQPQGADSLNPVRYLESVSAQGDRLKQLVLFGLYIGCVPFLFRVPLRAWLFLGAPLIGLTVWCFATIAWSIDPGLTLRRDVALCGTVLLGLLLGVRFDFRSILYVLIVAGVILLLGSLLLAIVDPARGLDFDGRLRGVSAHKNGFASFSAILLIVSIGSLFIREYSVAAILGSLAITCMALAHSAAVIPVVLVAIIAMMIAYLIRVSDRGMRALAPIMACAFVALVGVMVAHASTLAWVLGRDPDMSGRTVLWDFVLKMISLRPWLGYGFGAFWYGQNGPGMVFWQNTHLGAPHAHNGFLGLTLDVGGIGMLLFATAISVTLIRLLWLLRHVRHPMIPWALGLFAFYIITNQSESWLWVGNEALVALFVFLVVRTNMTMQMALCTEEVMNELISHHPLL